MTAIDLTKQQELDVDPKSIHNFTANQDDLEMKWMKSR